MKRNTTLIFYTLMLVFASCNYVTEFNSDSVANAVIIESEIIKEVQRMELQPIKDYDNYIVSGKRVFGIIGAVTEEVILKDVDDNPVQFNEFFIIPGDGIYLNAIVMEQGDAIPDTDPVQYEPIEKTYYFFQLNGTIEEITESEFPTIPESLFVEMDSAPYKIETFDYNGDDTSRVYQQDLPTGYQKVDGYSHNESGLWFSVPITISIRLKGIYFYPVNGNIIRKMDSGKIY